MRTLETTRVCIIDDEEKEYLPLIHVLSRLRLGCIHIAGDKFEELPPINQPLNGLRLVFLDMHLGTEGGDEAAITAHTAQVFSRVVSPNAGPLLVVVWTKYGDIVETFQKRLYENYPAYKGKLLFARIEKPVDSSAIEPDRLREAIIAKMSEFYPAELLWRWEQLVHDAASVTTEGISKRAASRAGIDDIDSEEEGTAKLKKGLSDVLRILISAEAEETISAQTAFTDLLGVLNPLHRDRLEHEIEYADSTAGEDLVSGHPVTPTLDERLELNTMLAVARHFAGGDVFRPGVIFEINSNADFQARFRISIPEVFGEILDIPKTADWNKLKLAMESRKLNEAQRAEKRAQFDVEDAKRLNKRDEWLARCVPILLDVSPFCDFAQNHPRLARLMSGLMVPTGTDIKFQAKGAFQKLPSVRIEEKGDTGWDLVFCSRFVFTLPPRVAADEVRPICRLRDSIVADLRGWAAAQDARAGYVSV